VIRTTATRIAWLALWAHFGWAEGARLFRDPGAAYAAAVVLLIAGVILADVLWLPQIAGSLAMRIRGREPQVFGTRLGAPRSAAIVSPEVDSPTPAAYTAPAAAAASHAESTSAAPSPRESLGPESAPTVGLAGEALPQPAEAPPAPLVMPAPPRPPGVSRAQPPHPPLTVNPPPGFSTGMTLVRQTNGKVEGKIIELDPAHKILRADILRWAAEGWQGIEAIPPEYLA